MFVMHTGKGGRLSSPKPRLCLFVSCLNSSLSHSSLLLVFTPFYLVRVLRVGISFICHESFLAQDQIRLFASGRTNLVAHP